MAERFAPDVPLLPYRLFMRIGTWNVAYGQGQLRNERRRSQMSKCGADVWVLTETHDDLSPGPGYVAVHAEQRPFDSDGVSEGSRWVSIWCRTGFVDTPIAVVDPERTVAALVECGSGPLLVYGTVLPWTNDRERPSMATELARQGPEWSELPERYDSLCCVAGDFNVNLGGPHFYGSNKSKAAVRSQLEEAGLVPVTDFDHTKHLRPDFGLVDHVAISHRAAAAAEVMAVFGPRNDAGELMSDHSGVVVEVAGW